MGNLRNEYINAFGNINNAFYGNSFSLFINRPIGLLSKSYGYLLNTLKRNIGNSTHFYDGYGTPIGELSNPFYNSIVSAPWFLTDNNKNATSNYIEYVKSTYGSSISVSNINENYDLRIIGEASSVGSVQTSAIYEAIVGDIPDNISLINPNNFNNDTMLGITSTYYVGKTLSSAVSENDKISEKSYTYGITKEIGEYFGINTAAITEHDILNISSHNKGDSYSSVGYFEQNIKSPLEISNYGNITDVNAYLDYYNSLGSKTMEFYNNNLNKNTYRPAAEHTEKNADGTNKSISDSNGKTYLESLKIIDDLQIRHIFKTLDNHSDIVDSSNGTVYVYSEINRDGKYPNIYGESFNSGIKFGTYNSFGDGLTVNDLLYKTNDAFKKGKYDTIIARFHTTGDTDITDTTQTAISKKYGMSRGRNLLKSTKDGDSKGYDNPYCRVWTYHNQYSKIANAIRPFQEETNKGSVVISQKELYETYGFNNFSADHSDKDFEDGRTRLGEYGVINQQNGLVNITPIDNKDPNKKVDIKKCMFSIENLAWKGVFSNYKDEKNTFQNNGLSPEQKGPFGGRIMWFPPYDLSFNESTKVDWDVNNFIGRGESIYTYKNTTRSGTLSFKLLIDHPSIVNYWENKGGSKSNSVDDDDPEQQLLRFFAGCEMLSSKKSETKSIETAVKSDTEPSPNSNSYVFYVFFPNNYSGVNDDPDFVMEYLTNGVGTWNKKDNTTYHPSYSTLSINDNVYGGYEMRAGQGISYVSEQTSDNKIASVLYGNQSSEDIYAQIGASNEHDWDNKWYYRIDKAYINNNLKYKENYIDNNSNCLNSLFGSSQVEKYLDVNDSDNLYSFTDVYVALTSFQNNSAKVLEGLYAINEVSELKELFSNKDKIKEIICTGQASSQGKENLNNSLANNRAKTVGKWLRKYFGDINIHTKTIESDGSNTSDDTNNIVNKIHRCVKVEMIVSSEETKTVQDIEKDAFRDGSEKIVGSPLFPIGKGIGEPFTIDNAANLYFNKSVISLKNQYEKAKTHISNNDYITFNTNNETLDNNLNVNGVYNTLGSIVDTNMASNDNALNSPGDYKYSNSYLENNGGKKEDINSTTIGNGLSLSDLTKSTETDNISIKRYDNESKFFELLETESPFLHQKISDKIKYFDPAFHSISPEGFNARLTFLQQCTRQGPTNNAGENMANNLAFGRPPVCILRIGDFYYTKIIIENITIDYANSMWDLNIEGIGVMPMLANVTIAFNYIGGSSLSGPISRLQNALSFNMYANTEVYDNRAELAQYDDSGELIKFGTNMLS